MSAQALDPAQEGRSVMRVRQWMSPNAVEPIMAAPAHDVRPDEPVGLAAELMLRWQVNGLPVRQNGRLVGTITTADCLRALVAELDQVRPRQPASGVLLDDPDWYKMTPMPPGDDRPGRRAPAPESAPAETVQPSPATSVDAALATDTVPAEPRIKETAGMAG